MKQKMIPAKMIAPQDMLKRLKETFPLISKCEIYIGRPDVPWPDPQGCAICRHKFNAAQIFLAINSDPIIRVVLAISPYQQEHGAECDLSPEWAHVRCLPIYTTPNIVIPQMGFSGDNDVPVSR